MNEYRFDRLSIANLYQLVKLYQYCFKLKVGINYLKQKYNTASFGASFIGYLAIDLISGEPAAYYGVFPIITRKDGVDYLVAQSGDTMTHPKHQGKGLFTKLATITYDLAKKEGIQFVFGFPNKNSYPGFVKKLNWQHYGYINNYSLKVRNLPFDKLAKKFPFFKYFYDSFVEKRLRNVVTDLIIPNSIEKHNPEYGYIVHDQKFYEYKTYFKSYKVKLNGINCIIKIDGRLWVGDIEFCNEENFLEMRNELQFLAKKLGCSTVLFSVFEGTFPDVILKKNFEIKEKNPVGALNLSLNVNPARFAYNAIDFDTY